MTEFWPHLVLKPANITRQLAARSTAGTVATSGFTQAVAVPAAAWRIRYERIVIDTAAQLRAWDRLEGLLEGRANAIYVPLVGEDQGTVDGALVGAHAAQSTSVVIARVGEAILAGYHFSIGDGRLHRVIDVTGPVGNNYTCEIRPWLRDSYSDAAAVELTMPACKCRLLDDDQMRLSVTPGRLAIADAIEWIEDPN